MIAATLMFAFWPSVRGLAWGEQAHRLVNAAAVESLPEPLRSYFRSRKAFLVEHAMDADLLAREDPQERFHHYTDVDAYQPDAFLAFKKLFVAEHRGPTAWEIRQGDCAWQIERFTLRLESALRHRTGIKSIARQYSQRTTRATSPSPFTRC